MGAWEDGSGEGVVLGQAGGFEDPRWHRAAEPAMEQAPCLVSDPWPRLSTRLRLALLPWPAANTDHFIWPS